MFNTLSYILGVLYWVLDSWMVDCPTQSPILLGLYWLYQPKVGYPTPLYSSIIPIYMYRYIPIKSTFSTGGRQYPIS